MKSFVPLLLTFATASLAAPTQTVKDRSTYDWSPALAEFYSVVDRHIQEARSVSSYPFPPTCDLSKAQMPAAPTPLPSPGPGATLDLVVIGRGIQNYTCAIADASTTPVAIGAVASLYNASCIAANYPDLLALLPNLALQYPLPADPSANLQPPNIDLSGHHFFANPTTPIFNLDADPTRQLGTAVGHKAANSTAPSDAPKGQNGVGDGAVPWLYLTTTNATVGNVKTVYRMNTAGGNPPATCQDSPAVFSVQYAAEYWFWSGGN